MVNFVNLLRDVCRVPVIIPLFLRSHEKFIDSKGIMVSGALAGGLAWTRGEVHNVHDVHFWLEEPIVLGYHPPMNCPIHGIPLVCYCPACRGGMRSEQKALAARENGKLGGRPKGSGKKRKTTKKGAK